MLRQTATLMILISVGLWLAAGTRAEEGGASDPSSSTFAIRLVEAARQQRAVPALYDPSYRKIPYPNGDVPWYIGVCTDVVVRAYRSLGIDLQELVHTSKVGSGDSNIDHRRVPVLMKFFASRGKTLPITSDPKDYSPGDIVAYHLPNGTFSKTHIAIVSNRQNWNGIPLVIHNIGYGVQEEDWLFAEKIIGHYRFETEPHMQSSSGANRVLN